jgi:hypothetical protein
MDTMHINIWILELSEKLSKGGVYNLSFEKIRIVEWSHKI